VDRPDPEPERGEVLVAIRAAGLNAADLLQRDGAYDPPVGVTDVLGLEFAGEVVGKEAAAHRFSPGDRVMSIVPGGGQADLAVVHERHLMPVPERLGWIEAGAAAEVLATAYDALLVQGGLRLGERVLVHGAAGGVGSAAVQLASAMGARVTATVRDPSRHSAVAQLGARVVAPNDFASHGPFDVVLELVGAPNITSDLDSLDYDGRLVVIGVGAGQVATVDLFAMMVKRVRLFTSTLRLRSFEQRALLMRRLESEVLPLIDSGDIRIPIAASFPLSRAVEAYEFFARRGKLGKVALTMR
jgi:NADPH2:quinone reductase